MILDTLDHADVYRDLLPGFEVAFEFLRGDGPASVEPGRHELDGSRVFVNVEAYTTRPVERCAWEAHRRYADIQFLVRGRERIDYAAASMLKRTQAYDSERDVTFYAGDGAPLQLTEGMFAIFLPQDAHRPCVAVGEPEAVRKAVAKVLLAETP